MSSLALKSADNCTPSVVPTRYRGNPGCSGLFTSITSCDSSATPCPSSNTAYRFCNIEGPGNALQQTVGPEEQRCKPNRFVGENCGNFQYAGSICPSGWKPLSSGTYEARSMSTTWCCPTDAVLSQLSVTDSVSGYCFGSSYGIVTPAASLSPVPSDAAAPPTLVSLTLSAQTMHYTAAAIMLYERGADGSGSNDAQGRNATDESLDPSSSGASPAPLPSHAAQAAANARASKASLSVGAVAGISVAACVFLLSALVLAGVFYFRRQKRKIVRRSEVEHESSLTWSKPELSGSLAGTQNGFEKRGICRLEPIYELEDSNELHAAELEANMPAELEGKG